MHLTSTVQVVVIEYVLPCTLADSLSNVRGGGRTRSDLWCGVCARHGTRMHPNKQSLQLQGKAAARQSSW
jgi:hypothetical protein